MSEPQAVRKGEELDKERLRGYLFSQDVGDGSEIEVQQFPAGSSNLTYLIRLCRSEYVLRRPPFGNTVKTAHDMRREFEVLSQLAAVYRPAPMPAFFCADDSVIGSEFYLMERRNGVIVRGEFNDARISGSAVAELEGSQERRLSICRSFIRNLSDLHRLDFAAAGLADLGKPAGYPRRQVEGWTKRYFNAKTDEHPELESAITWLNTNIQTESGASLVHNDYKFDNIMLDPDDLTRITAVLDWEMVTIGDPLMDLGTTLGYWMSRDAGEEMMRMPFNPRVLMENVTRRQLVEMYEDEAGRELPEMLFYYVFGTFKIAVICQQIYARFVKGLTKDQRFANFDRFVAALGLIAQHAIVRGSI